MSAEQETLGAVLRWRWRWYRAMSRVRCAVNIHCWRGHQDCGDGVNVAPYDGYSTPRRGCWRVCEWCGAKSEAAYDPMYGTTFWRRTS